MNNSPIGLLNAGPLTIPVDITLGGKKRRIEVNAVSAEDIIPLLVRFPEFRMLMDKDRAAEITPERLVKMSPEALGAVLASCTGTPGNEEAEANARKLGLGNQLKILKAAIPISFPEGLGPFVEDLRSLVDGESPLENPQNSSTTATTVSTDQTSN
jgi:hypothetical protein